MSARSLLLSAAVSIGLASIPAAAQPAAEQPTAEVENAKNSFPGIINSNAVYVRCGPAESYYPTMKLEKGARVTVVGIKLDWLKIVPPEGSFCYVAKAYVEKRGDGSVGRVTKDAVNVRAASSLNMLKVVSLCQLTQGQDVQILGELEEYFKIKPPVAAYLFVNKQFVDPDPDAAPKPIVAQAPAPVEPAPPVQPPPTQTNNTPTHTSPVPPEETPIFPGPTATRGTPAEVPGAAQAGLPTTRPAEAVVPTTSPAQLLAEAEQLFERTETEFAAAAGRPIDQQPIADLTKSYQQLAASDVLAPTLHRVIDSRLATLKLRAENADQLAQTRAAQEAMKQKQMALRAERQELEERLQQTAVSSFTAVGTLQASSLQLGGQTLYRLTDPANGRTVVYLRSGDGKIAAFLGKFIGVKGELATEPALSLKVITPTDADVVDPAKVNRGITSQVIPPSMTRMEASTDLRP